MAKLHDGDRDALLAAVEAVAATTTVEELSRAAIDSIRHLIPTTLAAWNEVASDGTIDAVMAPHPPIIWPEAPDAFARNVADHPVIGYYQRTGDGRPYAISDFLSPAEFHDTGLYREFYVRLNAEDQLSFIVPDPDRIIGIALNRDRPGFSERDRSVANLIRPHLTYAYRNARAHERVRLLSASLEELAEDHHEGVVFLDHRGQAGHISPSGARLLRQWFPDDPAAALPSEVLDWMVAQPALVNGQLIVERDGRMLSIRHLGGGGRRDGTLLISEQPDPDPRIVLRRLGLTPRQAEVVALATQGQTNAAIGARLGLSVRTVEGHISEGLHRLGVETRNAASHLIHQTEMVRGEAP